MNLKPVTSSTSPAYPIREHRTAKAPRRFGASLRKAAIAFGASALMGLAACGASDQHIENPELRLPGEAPATHVEPTPEPEQPLEPASAPGDEVDQSQLQPIIDEDTIHMAGGRRPPSIEPPPPPLVLPPPDTSDATQQPEQGPRVVPIGEDDIVHMAGGLRPPLPEPPVPQPPQPPDSSNTEQPDPQTNVQNTPPKPPQDIPVRLAGIAPRPRIN